MRSASDLQNFEFDLEILKEYVKNSGLDVIAITNHNCFNASGFNEISESLSCMVLPGIEANVTTPESYGHVIIIAPENEVSSFSQEAEVLAEKCSDEIEHLSWGDMTSCFANIDKCLVIPHYRRATSCHIER